MPDTRRRQLPRYALVGAAATVAHYALLAVWVEVLRAPAWQGAGAGAALGAQVAYLGNRWLTFGRRATAPASWWRFQAVAAWGGLLSMLLVAAGVRLGLHYLGAQAVATGVAMLVTFEINRRWTFGPTRGRD